MESSLRFGLAFFLVMLLTSLEGFIQRSAIRTSNTKSTKLFLWKGLFSTGLNNLNPSNKKGEYSDVGGKRVACVIIGSGISGLTAAKTLQENGMQDFIILEKADGVGGRVRTDSVDGFLLDRGFQVFIKSYPESRKIFNFSSLQLRSFLPGAIVRFDDKYHLVSDPLRRPQDLIPSLISPIGSLLDKIKVGILSLSIRLQSLESILEKQEMNTAQYLSNQLQLSPDMVNRFFKPFYQGIFLSPLSDQSSRMFEFVFKIFADGDAALPAFGMGACANQLIENIPPSSLKLQTAAQSITRDLKNDVIVVKAKSMNGDKKGMTTATFSYRCDGVIIATDPPASKEILSASFSVSGKKGIDSNIEIPPGRGSTCLYFGIDGPPPVTDPILILNGENSVDDGYSCTINNVCFPSQLSSNYAPAGKSLASVTVVGCINDKDLEEKVRLQLKRWWGSSVDSWQHLRTYRIKYAQPSQNPPYQGIAGYDPKIADGIYLCGDHRDTATLNGAISSGRKAALSFLAEKEGRK